MTLSLSFLIPLDSIEAHVETADLHVQNATQQLAQAADYQVGNMEIILN